MFVEFILLVSIVALIYQFLKPRPPEGFPPGPTNYPILGGVLALGSLGDTSSEKLEKFGEIYGPVSGLYFGKSPSIIVTGYEAAKEVFNKEEFSHRPSIYQFEYIFDGRALGVFFSNGSLWKEQRRFALKNLRDFGFGKSSMEGLIHEEAEECVKSIKKAVEQSGNSRTTIHDKFGISMVNILWATVSGNRFSHDDKKFRKILDIIQLSFRSGKSTGSLINDYPFLRFIPPFKTEFDIFMNTFKIVQDLLKESLEEHKLTREPNSPRDFIDVYLNEMETEQRKGNKDSTFFENQLLQVCQDLFNAGAESTSNTVAFAVLYMLLHPDIQEKLHEELDRVVGKSRFPSVNDKPNLHYTEAVMAESYRLNPIAPVSVPHSTIEDTKLCGYTIPKKSVILVNIRSIHRDKKYWGDAEVFRPERHLDPNGKFVKPERVIAFGFGKRGCLGEPLARMSAFLLFTTVMQHFQFDLVPGQSKPTTNFVDGFTVAPKPFEAIVTNRN